ncbi:tripartite tricarboxylate transporter permease [Methylobrevis albus]|uniref:Tripartite tricarboxylate transporter permease n=1 Tax=Methylobrevis albus TaxID=2793297 RepID=A0A931MYU3_9HYPH|nr:tripartite tricarboxylate transporter permease [Methylobrevis albus]MBH0238807.1 tripartite tricarboxylate transporter permease [Methylobrevis albus]
MDFLVPLVGGVSQLADPWVWLLVLAGTMFGVASGAMPGVGTTLAYGLVLPFTFAMTPIHGVAFLLAISVGVGYGNSIPAILMGIPGNPAAILTVIDGHTLHKRGEGGLALGVSFVAALGGQLVSILMFVMLVVPLMGMAYFFSYPEIFALYFLGMVALVSLTGDNVVKGLMAGALGISLGLVGLDPMNLTPRFDFGFRDFRSGIEPVALVIGLLAVSELFRSARQVFLWDDLSGKIGASRFPKWSKIRPAVPAMISGTTVGTFVGAIPGAGATPAAMIAYQVAQMHSKKPEEFGRGSIEGIGANEAAQNASNSGELIPTLGLGIPVSGSMVLLLAALTVQGFVPGPLMVVRAPELLYAAIAGLLASTVILLAVGWQMASLMLKAVMLNRQVVIVIALAMVVLGTYSINTKALDVGVAMVAGVVGYFMLRYGYSTAAAAFGVFLGSEFERNLRIGLNFHDGSFVQFFSRPITATIMLVALALLVFGMRKQMQTRRRIREAQMKNAV